MTKIILCLASGAAVLGLAGPADAQIRFKDVSEAAGVTDLAVNSTGPTFVDYDNDGDIDIFVSTEGHREDDYNRLFENQGNGRFENVALERGVDNKRSLSRGAAWGDIDNDGDMDMVVATVPQTRGPAFQPMTLFRNLLVETGEPNFENITRSARLMRAGSEDDERAGGVSDTAGGVAWADFDNDGLIDLYHKNADYEIDNVLFRNMDGSRFQDVTIASGAGIQDKLSESNSQGSPNWTDLNHDGRIDLLVTNEADRNVLFLNKGDGTFRDITQKRKAPRGRPFRNPGNANGACVGDLDNDGDMDFYLPTADQANRLIISQFAEKGEVRFKDITLESGAGDMGGARGCALADFDNDGYLDIYVNNGGLSNVLINDVISMPPSVQFYIAWEPAENKLYRNNGDLTFSDITAKSGAVGLGIGSGVGAADINDDGFADLFIANRTYYSMGKRVGVAQTNQLLVNRGNGNTWVRVALEGTTSNRDGYGARVKLVAGDLVQYREKTNAYGYNSGGDPRLLFGLGKQRAIDYIEVTWPSGKVQRIESPGIRQTVEITEPA